MKEQIWQQLILYTIEKGSGFESVVPTVNVIFRIRLRPGWDLITSADILSYLLCSFTILTMNDVYYDV